jgi:CheY-like chemotaxis protein
MALYKHKAENELQKKQMQLEKTLVDLKAAQEKIVQQERLAAVGHMAAGIAHDFNNIMASVILNTDMVLRSRSIVGKDRERISTIRQQGKHAADLTQKILDFCGMSVLQTRVVHMNQLIEAFGMEAIASLPANINVKIGSVDQDFVARVDPDRMQQAFFNIISNAKDAMPDGGEISIELEAVMKIIDGKQKDMVCFSISDTGEGIPSSILPHIFEPFFTTRSPLRTGLGLSQAHGIVKQHGGHIEVDSIAGKGTTVMVYLPDISGHNSDGKNDSNADFVKGDGQAILVIVSDIALREALISSLEVLNYHTYGAGSESSAMGILENDKDSIDLVLSDLSVPAFQGFETLQTLKAYGLEKVVFLTTSEFIKEIARWGLGDKVFGLEKPIDLDELARGVARVLS